MLFARRPEDEPDLFPVPKHRHQQVHHHPLQRGERPAGVPHPVCLHQPERPPGCRQTLWLTVLWWGVSGTVALSEVTSVCIYCFLQTQQLKHMQVCVVDLFCVNYLTVMLLKDIFEIVHSKKRQFCHCLLTLMLLQTWMSFFFLLSIKEDILKKWNGSHWLPYWGGGGGGTVEVNVYQKETPTCLEQLENE